MAAAIDTASEFFGIAFDAGRPPIDASTASEAGNYHYASTNKVDAAVLLLKDLIFRANDSDFDREIGEAYIEGAIALLGLSSANAQAVEMYISLQIARELGNRPAPSAGDVPEYAEQA